MTRLARHLLFACLALALPARAGPPVEAAPREALRTVQLRVGPALYHAVLESLPAGARLTVLQDGQRWVKVRTVEGREGWVSARAFLVPPEPGGYGALLGKPGLAGVSEPVVTMAARSLLPSGPEELAARLLAASLAPLAVTVEEAARFQAELSPDDLAEGCQDKGPGHDFAPGELRLGLLLAARTLGPARVRMQGAATRLVNQVGLALAARSSRWDLDWRFALLDDPAPRAVGLPGGLVLVTTGLLGALEDERALAVALGRAIARVCLAQGAGRLAGLLDAASPSAVRGVELAAEVLLGPPTPEEERAAGALGARLADCAGFTPARAASPGARVHFQALQEDLR